MRTPPTVHSVHTCDNCGAPLNAKARARRARSRQRWETGVLLVLTAVVLAMIAEWIIGSAVAVAMLFGWKV